MKLLKNQKGVKDALVIEKSSGLACGSTIDEDEEEIIVGMISLLIVTVDKVASTMEFEKFKEIKLRTDSDSLLLTEVNQDLILVIFLQPEASDDDLLGKIEDIGDKN